MFGIAITGDAGIKCRKSALGNGQKVGEPRKLKGTPPRNLGYDPLHLSDRALTYNVQQMGVHFIV